MGGKGSGRKPEPKVPIGIVGMGDEPMFIPNLSGDHSAGNVQDDPVKPTDLVNKEYVDNIALATVFDFYAYDDNSDIGGYKEFKLAPSTGAEVEGNVSILGNATGQAVGARVTEDTIDVPSLITTLQAGLFTFHVHMRAATANRLKFYAELYVRAAGGTETLITTTIPTGFIGLTGTGYNSHGDIPSSVVLTAGDRLVVKGYATNASPAATTLYIAVEGDTATRISIPGLTSPVHHDSLINLDYASAGHTGFASAADTTGMSGSVTLNTSDILGTSGSVTLNTSLAHAESHTVASHSDTTGTGAELDELTDGSTTTLHSHAGGGSSEWTKTGSVVYPNDVTTMVSGSHLLMDGDISGSNILGSSIVSGSTIYSTTQLKCKSNNPSFWLDETDQSQGCNIVHAGKELQFQKRAQDFGAYVSTPMKLDMDTGDLTITGNAKIDAVIHSVGGLTSSSDAYDVSNLSLVAVWAGSGDIRLGGLTGGTAGQMVHFYIGSASAANKLIIEHNEATGTEKLLNNTGVDHSFNSAYRGITYVRDSNGYWYQQSWTG